MEFWRNLQFWVKTPINTGFNLNTGFNMNTGANYWNTEKKKNYKSNVTTYNSRYPWFDEEDYKKLERLASERWVTGQSKTQLMDELYQYYYPQVANSHKLDDRQVELNQMTYEIDWNQPWVTWLKLTSISQKAKQKFNIDASVNDNELLWSIVDWTPNWDELLEDYINNGNPEFLYAAWIEDRPQQWWIKSLVNPTDSNILPEKNERYNPIWAAFETTDNAAWEFADKWLDFGNMANEKATENLKNEIENMSDKELEKYRKQYEKELKNGDWRAVQVEWDTIVEKLWNAVKWNIKSDYTDEWFMKWLIDNKKSLWQDISWADEVLKWESNPSVIQFFGNIPASAIKTFTATVRWLTNPYDTLKWLYTLAATEEWHQAILNRYGSWDAFAKAMNEDPVGVADDMLAVAELWTNIVSWWLKGAWKITWNTNLTNAANTIKWWNIWSANDALANKTIGKIYGWLDNLADMTDNKLVQWAVRYAEDVSNVQKLKDNAKSDFNAIADSTAWQAIKNYVNEWIDKLVWVDEADREFIRDNKELVNNYIDGKKNVETVFEEVKNKINDKRQANTKMWKEYANLRKNKSKVVDTTWVTTDMKKTLKENWITIDKKTWDLKFNELSKYNAKQKRALQDAWDELKALEKAKKINAGNVLDMRQKMDDKLNWDGKASDLKDITAVDKSTEKLIKEMRWVIDERAKGSVKWLKELDEKFAPAMAEMEKLQKDWLNSDWTLKDTARSKIRNLTKAGNEERLARLEKLIPWISQDLKALDVWLTIDRATKQWVWQYSKNIWLAWTIWFAASWNIPAALVSAWIGILATPKNFVRVIEAYPDIANKLQAWKDLLPSDISRLQSLASRISDTVEE